MKYEDFLSTKAWAAPKSGIDVDADDLCESLFDFQRDCVQWALRRGKACLFLDCGLGKTICQLDWARHVPGDVLILAPLAVGRQTQKEGELFGIECELSDGEKMGKITISNYEKLHRFTPAEFDGIVLDESSILKSYTGKYRTSIIEWFESAPYKLACTATPAPNDIMELANHVEFMGIMKRAEFLASWFCHDGGETQKWRLKGHAERLFWEWMAEWAIVMRNPADLGYDGEGFNLPELTFNEHFIETGLSGYGQLFTMPAQNLTEQRRARRQTMEQRVSKAASIVNASNEPWIVWCELNDESAALTRAIDGAIEVAGAQDDDVKESNLAAFSSGEKRVIVTKPKIAGHGLNWQHCSHQLFVGLSHSFEQTYQAIRRSWRFGQRRPVDINIIVTDLESAVADNVAKKQEEHEKMVINMVNQTRIKTIEELKGAEREKDEYSVTEKGADGWTVVNGDCVVEAARVHNDTVGLSVFSPPFASLYTYSASDRDMGNCRDYEEFMEHFGYLIDEIHRITMPGRNCCVHCMDLPISKEREGFIGIRDFPGIITRAFTDRGWIFHSRVVIWKDPVTAMQRTKAIGLLWKQIKKDSTISRQGIPDYVLTFRKPGDNPEPVTHSSSEFPVDQWQKWASPVWMDINTADTLQRESAREEQDERHIAPLQLEVIRRCIRLWSNPGDMVFSPFAGIGSEGYVAVQEERRFFGIELKASYWRQACRNLEMAKKQLSLF